MAKQLIGLDCETYDPLLKDAGWSWKYGEGYILCTALYYAENDTVAVIAGKYNENSPYSKDERAMMNKMSIESILRNPNVCIVGANLQYDIGWLLYEYGMSTYDVKCSFIDVLIAEHLLDEFNIHTLDELSWKYLKYGKTKDRIETWVRENVSAKGDFRKYLKDAPWDLLCEYVTGDAKNPVNIWKKQLTLLKEQDLCSRTKLEFDCLLPILQITMNGYPIDVEQKEKNKKELEECISLLEKEFRSKYDMPTFRVTASNDIASFCDKRNIPYRCKITLKGYNGELLGEDYVKIDSAYNRAKKIVSSFQYVKSKPVAYVPKEMAERTCDLLSEEGFTYTCSPNVDKKFFDSAREEYPEIGLIADWKLAKGILSKILGEKYDRFIQQDKDGVYKVHPQFKTTDTISMRLSSVMPNCIAGSMKVMTPKGWKRIDKLRVGDEIYNGNGDITTVKNIWYKGVQNCLLTVSNNGYRIITTPEHKVWNGTEEKEIKDCEQIGVIERRTNSEIIPLFLNKRADSRCSTSKSLYSNRSAQTKVNKRRIYEIENTAQNQNSRSIYKSKRKSELCERISFSRKTIFQRFMCKIQDFFEQGKELFEKAFNRGAKKRTTQFACSTSKISEKWSNREAPFKLQRYLCGFRRLCFRVYYFFRRRNKQSKIKQKSFCRSLRSRCTPTSSNNGRTSYRHRPLEQQLRQLGFMYKASTRKITQAVTKPQKVYDIEVMSEDHSFICEGFRVFNCQQIPSKGGFTITVNGKEKEVSFPALTRALFKPTSDKILWKIDYGQIEYRLICNIAVGEGSKEVREEFKLNPKLDFHQYVVDLTGLSRKYAKNMSFGISFGMGLKSMAGSFGWTMEKAEEISEQYNARMPFVQPTLALVGDVAKKRGYIRTVCGSHARLPNPNKSYTMLNRYTQGSGAEILKSSIVRAYKEGLWEKIHVVNTIHDELNGIISVSEDSVRNIYEMAKIMTTTVPLNVPLEAEPELGLNWAETKTIGDWLEIKNSSKEEWEQLPLNLRQAIEIADKIRGEYE